MGELVPYGKVWRTGADEATTLTTDKELQIGGTIVPAGKYTLYTLPGQTDWQLIVNKQTGQWGTEYDQKQDLGRVPLKKNATPAPVEQLTISIDKNPAGGGLLKIAWENTELTRSDYREDVGRGRAQLRLRLQTQVPGSSGHRWPQA